MLLGVILGQGEAERLHPSDAMISGKILTILNGVMVVPSRMHLEIKPNQSTGFTG